MKIEKITRAVIPVAGLGTRFLPFTKTVPKALVPILTKPTIEYVVAEAIASGIEEILFITPKANNEALVNFFKPNKELEIALENAGKDAQLEEVKQYEYESIKFYYIAQPVPLGLGASVNLAKDFTKGEPFALMLGDDVTYSDQDPVLKQLIDQAIAKNGSILGIIKVPKKDISKYGVVSFKLDEGQEQAQETEPEHKVLCQLNSVVEKPHQDEAPSDYAIVGRYVLSPTIFDFLAEMHVDPKTKEIQITDSICKLLKKEPVYGYEFNGERYDMGSKLGFLKAQIAFAMRDKDPSLKKEIKQAVAEYIMESEKPN